jgi:uncharacterized protein (TIGR01244 family)
MQRQHPVLIAMFVLFTLILAPFTVSGASSNEHDSTDKALTVHLRDPIATVEREHKITAKIVDAARKQARSIKQGGPIDVQRLKKMHDFFVNFADRCHHQKEERYLFPLLKKHGVAEAEIEAATDQHERGRKLLNKLAQFIERDSFSQAQRGDLVKTLESYVGLMQGHIQLEDARIWDKARQVLTKTEKKRLAMAFRVIETLELGEGFHEKYHGLAKELLGKESAETKLKADSLGQTARVHTYNGYYLASQPSPDDFKQAAKRGVATVINLRYPDETDVDEQQIVTDLGMAYKQVSFNSPEDLTARKLNQIRELLSESNQPVLLHCSSANRVGAAWLAYRVAENGEPFQSALKEAKKVGLRTEGFIDVARKYVDQQ